MARFTRVDVINRISENGVVPIFYHKDPEICRNVIKACYDGGMKIIEYTNRGDFAHEVFSEVNKWAMKELPDMMIGAGTIVDAGTASLYIQFGADFIVSPILNPDMAKVCNRRKILWTPGCATLSEINQAEELGAEIVKLFPVPVTGGPEFLKSIKGPCPWTSIMATGGIEPTYESLKPWFDAGVTCVGMGSNLLTKALIEKKDWKGLTEKIARMVEAMQKARNRN
jgi:2-dehydro-3-deoxyphosphogluconate aldolase/(4S)-4-hydroxy-2-oxoglutarate aldolase